MQSVDAHLIWLALDTFLDNFNACKTFDFNKKYMFSLFEVDEFIYFAVPLNMLDIFYLHTALFFLMFLWFWFQC